MNLTLVIRRSGEINNGRSIYQQPCVRISSQTRGGFVNILTEKPSHVPGSVSIGTGGFDDGGIFVVHMFTHLADKDAVHAEVSQGADKAAQLIGDVEQDSAMLASEDNDFLIKMGVSRKLLTEVMYKQKAVASGEDKSTRRCLTGQEAVKYNVANAQ